MTRKLLTVVLPLALPFLIYGGYVLVARWKQRRVTTGDLPGWASAPWLLLIASSAGLLLVVLVGLRVMQPDCLGGSYQAARYQDGQIMPGAVLGDRHCKSIWPF